MSPTNKNQKTKKANGSSTINTWLKRGWLVFASGLVLAVLFFVTVSMGWWGEMPDIKKLENPETKLASEIYTSDGELLGKYFYQEDRTNSEFEDFPEFMINALIATEDARFHEHSGIDGRALIRAVVFMGSRGGASTITQQLAKNLFHKRESTLPARILQKIKEWIIAVQLERRYTKQEIITMYFNTVAWGNSYGIKSAAKRYFNKPIQDLSVPEAAVLVGMLKAPTYYSPKRNPDNATKRRNVVMSQMKKYGYLTDTAYDTLKEQPLVIDYQPLDHHKGLAPYFREYLRDYLKDWCEEKGYNLYDDGLKIYTTIDSRMQKYAEASVSKHMKSLQQSLFREYGRLKQNPWRDEEHPWKEAKGYVEKHMKYTPRYYRMNKSGYSEKEINDSFNKAVPMRIYTVDGPVDTLFSPLDSLKYYKSLLHAGFLAMEPGSGQIKAWVGGINHEFFQYDHVNVSANRQVGSTFKPIVYSRALEEELIQPCEKVSTGPVTIVTEDGTPWVPRNSGKVDEEEVTIYTGLKKSINTVTARVMKRLGSQSAIEVQKMAGKMGIDTRKFVPYPSICLGTMDLSVYEMVGAYGTFANMGEYVEPVFIMRIEDKFGNILEEFVPKRTEAMRPQTAYVTLKMLEKVTMAGGTGVRLRYKYGIPADIPVAGKTGTTQNNSDGWFMGVTPNLVTGTWVGAEDRQVHFRSTSLGQGANMALPIYAQFLKSLINDSKVKIETGAFVKPEIEFTIQTDCEAYDEEYSDDENMEPVGEGIDI